MTAELRLQLETRLADFEGYQAPLSREGLLVIDDARGILATADSSGSSLERMIDRLEHPETTWFEPMIGEWNDGHLEMLGKTSAINATFGCSYVCDFCGANAPPKVTVAPWPWLLEVRQNSDRVGKKGFSLMDFSDPLRDYYDPVFRRHYGHVNELFPESFIFTRGVFRDSPGEQAVLFIKERTPNTEFHISIGIVNLLYRMMGREGFTEFLRHSVELFSPNVSFNENATTLLGDQQIFIEIWEAITGERIPHAVGASYAGRLLHLDASRYENVEPWPDVWRCYLGSRQMIMPNGDIAVGPLDFAATEYNCVWKRPGTTPVVKYVKERSPVSEYTDRVTHSFQHFNRIHHLYSGPNEWCEQSFWDGFLREFMEGSRKPKLEDILGQMREYALSLSGMSGIDLNTEYRRVCSQISERLTFSLGGIFRENVFGKYMKIMYDLSRELGDKRDQFDKFFLIMREFIYREWDAGLRPRSYSS